VISGVMKLLKSLNACLTEGQKTNAQASEKLAETILMILNFGWARFMWRKYLQAEIFN